MRLHFCGRVSLPILAIAFISLGCADDEPFTGPTASDLVGTWNFGVTITHETGDCVGDNEPPWNAEVVITRVGDAVTVTGDWHSNVGSGPHSFVGTLTGMHLEIVGAYPEGDGTTSATYELTVAADWNRMTGTETWTWTNGVLSCVDSQSLVVANRVNP
jgi:hypothetical protein